MKLAYWNGNVQEREYPLYHYSSTLLLQLCLKLVKELHAPSWMDIFSFNL